MVGTFGGSADYGAGFTMRTKVDAIVKHYDKDLLHVFHSELYSIEYSMALISGTDYPPTKRVQLGSNDLDK